MAIFDENTWRMGQIWWRFGKCRVLGQSPRVLAICLMMVTIFCSNNSPGEVDAKEPVETKVATPARVETAMRTIEVTPEKAEAGKALFVTCSACHGPGGEGRLGTGPRLISKTFLASASDEFLMKTISEGRLGTTMVPWKAIYKPEQIESIVAYLRSLNSVEPAELDDSPLKGDAANGEMIYSAICSACHGKSGAGYMETSNGTGIGRKVFLVNASNGFMRHIIRYGKDLTKMLPFDEKNKVAVANLTNQEVEDVIVYLRNNAW